MTNGTLLQYVDDLLISNTNKKDSDKNSILVLNVLSDRGHSISQKAQITSQQVQYLGYLLAQEPGLCHPKENRPHWPSESHEISDSFKAF